MDHGEACPSKVAFEESLRLILSTFWLRWGAVIIGHGGVVLVWNMGIGEWKVLQGVVFSVSMTELDFVCVKGVKERFFVVENNCA